MSINPKAAGWIGLAAITSYVFGGPVLNRTLYGQENDALCERAEQEVLENIRVEGLEAISDDGYLIIDFTHIAGHQEGHEAIKRVPYTLGQMHCPEIRIRIDN